MKLLVVDDELLIGNVIKEYALNEGYTVDEAEDVPNDALQLDENYYILKGGVFYQLSTIREILSVLEK